MKEIEKVQCQNNTIRRKNSKWSDSCRRTKNEKIIDRKEIAKIMLQKISDEREANRNIYNCKSTLITKCQK